MCIYYILYIYYTYIILHTYIIYNVYTRIHICIYKIYFNLSAKTLLGDNTLTFSYFKKPNIFTCMYENSKFM